MIKKLIVVIFVAISCIGYSQNKNINFELGTFEEALAKANKENKLLFVDCYTTWCGPCKQMDKYVLLKNQFILYSIIII